MEDHTKFPQRCPEGFINNVMGKNAFTPDKGVVGDVKELNPHLNIEIKFPEFDPYIVFGENWENGTKIEGAGKLWIFSDGCWYEIEEDED